VGSIQRIEVDGFRNEFEPGTNLIALFLQPYFGGHSFSSDMNVFMESEPESSHTRSFLTIGNSDWELEIHTGDTVCFRIRDKTSTQAQICAVADISKYIGSSQIHSITAGCIGNGNIVHVRDCRPFGVNEPGPGKQKCHTTKFTVKCLNLSILSV
jgi:hypothetical protein